MLIGLALAGGVSVPSNSNDDFTNILGNRPFGGGRGSG